MELVRGALYYQVLVRHKVDVVMEAENGIEVLNLVFGKRNFTHLFGLDKLNDRPNLKNPKVKDTVIEGIINDERTRAYIKSSIYYQEKVKTRIYYFILIFCMLNLAKLYEWKVTNYSTIKADFVFVYEYFNKNLNKPVFIHFFIIKNEADNHYHPVSFFYDFQNKAQLQHFNQIKLKGIDITPLDYQII